MVIEFFDQVFFNKMSQIINVKNESKLMYVKQTNF